MSPRRRRLVLVAAVAAAWPAVAGAPSGGRVVWHETHDNTHSWPLGQDSNHAEYRIVVQHEPNGTERTLSSTLSWASEGELQQRVIMAKTGSVAARHEGDYAVSCAGGGSFDLGTSRESITRALQEIAAHPTRCTQIKPSAEWALLGGSHPLVWSTPGGGMAPMSKEQLGERCEWSESKTWTDDVGTHTETRHVWMSRMEAVVEIAPADAVALKRFVPEPGRWLAITVRSNAPTLFRFELDGVSRYPGFATNANVDEAFFAHHPLVAHLRGRYQHGDPDFIFDPRGYEGERAWKWNGWNSVETTTVSTVATMFVTAMDYAAWGRLRVLARGDCGGRFEPAEIRVGGRSRGYLVLPVDDNDDLMADALPAYAGDPSRDDEPGYVDADFPEDAQRGDGLTAFEEYRGFRVRGKTCTEPKTDVHLRTSPKRRDLFVNATHAALTHAVSVFGDSADLDPHLICARHYFDNETRVVNGTLQPGPSRFRGHLTSQSEPQHGLLLKDERLVGEFGLSPLGPPKNVRAVLVDVERSLASGANRGPAQLLFTVTHELGHALAIDHHGSGNETGPVVLLDQESCRFRMREGTVAGQVACELNGLAVRNGQNSGDQDCPMRYAFWHWYVTPGSRLQAAGNVEFVVRGADGSEERVQRAAFRLTGSVKRYEQDQDYFGLARFCDAQRGTGINALPGDRNHAGDSTRICGAQLRVNDVR